MSNIYRYFAPLLRVRYPLQAAGSAALGALRREFALASEAAARAAPRKPATITPPARVTARFSLRPFSELLQRTL